MTFTKKRRMLLFFRIQLALTESYILKLVWTHLILTFVQSLNFGYFPRISYILFMLQSIFDIQSAGVTKQKRTLLPEFLSTHLLFNFDFDIEFIDTIRIFLFRALDESAPSQKAVDK